VPDRGRHVRLLQVDAGLRNCIPANDRRMATALLTVAHHELPAGPWNPEDLVQGDEQPFAALVVAGVVVQEVQLAGRLSAELLGPGDVFRPWRVSDTALPCSMRWFSGGGGAIAVLDDRFLAAARRWPDLSSALWDRLADRVDATARRAAITSLPRVEQRVLALFWQLADRWGVVRPEGVLLRIGLTHELIGRLVGAKRPTVSLALATLTAEGLLARSDADAWLLSHGSDDVLGSDKPASVPNTPVVIVGQEAPEGPMFAAS
jgi:CRP-like cAMP-binding protein